MTFQVGKIYPYSKPRGLTGGALPVRVWHALRVPPGQERAKRDSLMRADGVFAFYPEQNRTRSHRGRKIVTTGPIVSQLVYARFECQPNWDVMKDRGVITGVIAREEWPVEIDSEIIRALRGLPTRASEIAEAKERMRRKLFEVSVGDRARLTTGPLAETGLAVEVTKVTDKRIWWAGINSPLKGDCAFGSIKRTGVARCG